MTEKKDITILLIDDEEDILELIEEEFNFHGYKTLTATCGNDAVKILADQSVDVVVSDYKMPNGNGMVVLDFVNKMEESVRPDFFFVSGQADVSIQEAIEAGAKKFFSKPFDLEELISEVESEIKDKLS